MNIKKIPEVLFNEFSKRLGKGDIKHLVYNGLEYTFRELDYKRDSFQFSGAIGITRDVSSGDLSFVLWSRMPLMSEKRGIISSSTSPIVIVFSRDEKTGLWNHIKGDQMEEQVLIRGETEFNVSHPSIVLISLILKRASELAVDASCEIFWTKGK